MKVSASLNIKLIFFHFIRLPRSGRVLGTALMVNFVTYSGALDSYWGSCFVCFICHLLHYTLVLSVPSHSHCSLLEFFILPL